MNNLNDDDLELAEFERNQEDFEAKKGRANSLRGVMSGLGSVLQSEANVPSAYEYLYNKKIKPTDFQGSADRAASLVQDPTDPSDRSRKAMEYVKMKREGRLASEQDATTLAKKDPNSTASKAAKQIASRFGIQVTPEMSAFDVEQMMDPKKMMEAEAMSRVGFENQVELEKLRQKGDMQKLGAQMAAEKAKPGYGMTDGQKKVDTDYAQHYNDFTGKGRANAVQTINQLQELKAELDKESGDVFQSGGGRLGSLLPDAMRTTNSLRWKSEIPAKANLVLKDLFGGQLSDGERKAEAQTYYNDMLGPKENSQLLSKKIDTLQKQLESETEKARYYEANGSLRGFKVGGTPVMQAGGGQTPKTSNPKDQKAMQWALSNQGDPRAKAILDRLGVDSNTAVGQR